MDAESFGNDDFVGCVTVQLQKMGESGNKWYPIADPEKKTQAKQLSGSLLLGCELVKSEKGRLEEEIRGREKEKDKLKKDIAKVRKVVLRSFFFFFSFLTPYHTLADSFTH